MTPYKKERSRHTATLINDKLYILGGDVGRDFFYLDVSVPFNTQKLLWNELSNINNVPSHYAAASVNSGENNDRLLLYGGVVINNPTVTDFVYIFNPQSNSWSIPKITENIPPKISGDTPLKKGGDSGKSLALNQVYLYDTINDNWSTKTTSGIVPSGRDGFSAVLGSDGQRVIIYGGVPAVNQKFTPEDSFYELNVINFEWRIPKISGKIPKSRAYHRANVIGKYMVITFGEGYDRFTESDILLLDISNVDEYIWTYEFYPPPPPQSSTKSGKVPTSPSSPSAMPPSIIVQSQSAPSMTGAIIGSLIGGATLSSVGFLLYRWNKNRQKSDNNNI
ncbi:hypothetical protein C1646_668381 [Rhizophagus diaphanus]|nr:hypothetical protein C1646_668381 [Rhizophagus diaphanus] [Rhizophagus sp. MUCL 43196]